MEKSAVESLTKTCKNGPTPLSSDRFFRVIHKIKERISAYNPSAADLQLSQACK